MLYVYGFVNIRVMKTLKPKYVWDYDLPKNWVPKTKEEWLWLLERKINYDDWEGLEAKIIKKYFHDLKTHLDPGKRMMLELYFKKYARADSHTTKES